MSFDGVTTNGVMEEWSDGVTKNGVMEKIREIHPASFLPSTSILHYSSTPTSNRRSGVME
jgi:hypothetical protein